MNRLHDWAQRYNISAAALAELTTLFVPDRIEATGAGEATTQAGLRVLAPRLGCALWRNNVGAALDESGRVVRYGLGNDSKKLNDVWKSHDLIGITPVQWAGRVFGVFTSVEVKKPGWRGVSNDRERAQFNFGVTVESLGGIAMFATSTDDYQKRVRP
jgi:hypothetical protein